MLAAAPACAVLVDVGLLRQGAVANADPRLVAAAACIAMVYCDGIDEAARLQTRPPPPAPSAEPASAGVAGLAAGPGDDHGFTLLLALAGGGLHRCAVPSATRLAIGGGTAPAVLCTREVAACPPVRCMAVASNHDGATATVALLCCDGGGTQLLKSLRLRWSQRRDEGGGAAAAASPAEASADTAGTELETEADISRFGYRVASVSLVCRALPGGSTTGMATGHQ